MHASPVLSRIRSDDCRSAPNSALNERGLMRVRLGGSSAYVAPAPLASSQIPSARPVPPLLQPPTRQEPPIWLPGVASPIPNLPNGPKTSQDRRARCMFQSGLYCVPLANFSQYMGSVRSDDLPVLTQSAPEIRVLPISVQGPGSRASREDLRRATVREMKEGPWSSAIGWISTHRGHSAETPCARSRPASR
jgi:hypothetical protein